jgi:ribonucleoside-diphosphate reductase alpha chain
MKAVDRDEEYTLTNPRSGQRTGKKRAREVFRRIVENAWKNGDPGLVFIDRINRDNPTPALGAIEATNPCGEQPLLAYESCNLGSINLSKFVDITPPPPVRRTERGVRATNGSARTGPTRPQARNGKQQSAVASANAEGGTFDWDALADVIPLCVRFLDNVIDANKYPIPQIDEMTKKTRKIGLGVMGWADVLFKLGIPYDSEEAIELGARVMSFIQEHADRASEALAAERGTFPAWGQSVYARRRRLRNATRTTVAPTGTLSIIADCSGGIEPAFALAFMRQHFLDRRDPAKATQLPEVNPTFRATAEAHGFYSEELVRHLAEGGSLSARDDVPVWAKRVFVTSHDIAPAWHVRMQAAFQRHTDNAVSKTINFRSTATVDDVEAAYMLAYRQGCKGITVYRDGSRDQQVLSHATARGPEQAEAEAAEIALRFADVLPADMLAWRGAHPEPQGSLAPRPPGAPYRRHLPDERRSVTHKFRVGEQEGYVTVGLYDDGLPGEIFVNISKEGSTIRGLMDSVAVLTSVALQYGVPLRNLVEKFRGVHFEPAGMTSNPQVPTASSLVDYIFRWLEVRFLGVPPKADTNAKAKTPKAKTTRGSGRAAKATRASVKQDAAATRPVAVGDGATSTGIGCPECGAILYFSEGCFVCKSCGYTRC